jgi:hypothetical protein
MISGRIGKHYGLSSELFSGLATSTTGQNYNSFHTKINPKQRGLKISYYFSLFDVM